MDKMRFKVRGSNIISSLNQKHINEGFPGTEIGLPIDRPNCEGKVLTRDEKEVDSITLKPKEWCWFYGKGNIKYTVHNVRGKMKVFKGGTQQVKPTKEMLKLIQIEDNESISVSGISTPTGRLHPEYEYDENIKEAAEGEEGLDVDDGESEETDDSETEEPKEKENELHTGIVIDADGKRKVKCPECGSFDVNIHDNGSIFHCVACSYEWPTKDADDDGYEDEKEQKDDILVQPEEDEKEQGENNESIVIEAFDVFESLKDYHYLNNFTFKVNGDEVEIQAGDNYGNKVTVGIETARELYRTIRDKKIMSAEHGIATFDSLKTLNKIIKDIEK